MGLRAPGAFLPRASFQQRSFPGGIAVLVRSTARFGRSFSEVAEGILRENGPSGIGDRSLGLVGTFGGRNLGGCAEHNVSGPSRRDVVALRVGGPVSDSQRVSAAASAGGRLRDS